MAKNTKLTGFSQLAKSVSIAPADLETPKEPVLVATSITRNDQNLVVDCAEVEDLDDIKAQGRGLTPHVTHIDEMAYRPTAVEGAEDEINPLEESVEDERELEESSPGLNDDSLEEVENVPTLNDRDVQTWTTAELEAYITRNVDEEVYHSTVVKAITEHRIRENTLDKAWTISEAMTFLETGIVPAKTTKGAWVKDETRKYRREHEWSTQELESWATGEIEPEGVTLPGGLALELKQRLALIVPSADVEAILTCYRHTTGQVHKANDAPAPTAVTPTVTAAQKAAVVKQINYEGLSDMNQSYLESSLATFGEVMAPGKAILPVTGGEAQKLLMQVINYAIRLQDPVASRSAMTYLLNYFRGHRADGQLFEDTYAFRFIEDMRATKAEQESHSALLTLFLVYADPLVELRAQTDTYSLIKGVPSQYQSRVIEFFSKQ